MSAAKKILEDALELPADSRAKVAAALLASLEQGERPDPDADATWVSEIERRAERVQAGESRGEPWDAVRRRLVSRLKSE